MRFPQKIKHIKHTRFALFAHFPLPASFANSSKSINFVWSLENVKTNKVISSYLMNTWSNLNIAMLIVNLVQLSSIQLDLD